MTDRHDKQDPQQRPQRDKHRGPVVIGGSLPDPQPESFRISPTLPFLDTIVALTLVAVLFQWLPTSASEEFDRIQGIYWFATWMSIAIFSLVTAVAIVIGNLLADLLAPLIDPRIRLR